MASDKIAAEIETNDFRSKEIATSLGDLLSLFVPNRFDLSSIVDFFTMYPLISFILKVLSMAAGNNSATGSTPERVEAVAENEKTEVLLTELLSLFCFLFPRNIFYFIFYISNFNICSCQRTACHRRQSW